MEDTATSNQGPLFKYINPLKFSGFYTYDLPTQLHTSCMILDDSG
jgi:hypothetical protein